MDGIVNILKPPGMTSADVVGWLRRVLKTKKIGHTGTLDPGVAGVLPLCIGKGTRLAEYLTAQGKAYRAEITFGIITDTQDAFGQILHTEKPDISEEALLKVLPKFCGNISQLPPMYSAVRKEGKHLYEYARQGIEVERSAREVDITSLRLERMMAGEFPRAVLDVECSKGTYIRTLCHDIGNELRCGAHMSYLLRTRSGPFRLENSWTVEEIETAYEQGNMSFLMPLTVGLELPLVRIPYARVQAFRNGLPTGGGQTTTSGLAEETHVQVFAGEEFLGIGLVRQESVYPHKVL